MTRDQAPQAPKKRGRPKLNAPTAEEAKIWKVRCKATAKHSGEQCKQWAMKGQTVCRKHGGSAPQNRAKGRQRMAEWATQAAVERYTEGIARKATRGLTDPLAALSELGAEAMATKDALSVMVNDLRDQLTNESIEGVEQTRAVVQLWERAFDRAVRICETMARLDVEGKRVKIQQEQADLMAGLIMSVLGGLGLTPAQYAQAQQDLHTGLQRVMEQTKEISA
ncbi:MAG: hypothetical protein L0I17_07890 [Actinomycetia bacterium]|nr:hypothetical protein [Actinomycetes bacterium]